MTQEKNFLKYILKYETYLTRDKNPALSKIISADTLKIASVLNNLLSKYGSIVKYSYIKSCVMKENYGKSQR